MTDWAVGMRCVLIRDFDIVPGLEEAIYPVRGVVYTVREVLFTGCVVLRLSEISNAHLIGRQIVFKSGRTGLIAGEVGFEADFFRPLSETRLDQFREHLAPASRETEDA